MKKKIASLLLTLALCLGLYPAALAAEPEPALYYVEASQDYVEVGTQTAVDGKEYPLFIYPAGTTFAFGEQSQGVSALVLMVWKFSTLEAGASFYDPDFTTGPVENKVFTPEPGVVYLLEETNTVDSFRDTYIMVQSGTPAEEPADGGQQDPDETAAKHFTDVPESAYYYAPVQWAVEQGITAGRTETTFAPGENCTRANIVTFLWRAAGSPEPTLTEQQFMDVADPGAYYYKAVQWAAEKDMWSFGTFEPNAPCDRLTAVYFLWRAAGSPEMEGQLPFTDVPFGDGDDSGQPLYRYADQAVLWAVENGVTTGKTETTFAPSEICTRGHIVTFLYRAQNTPAGEAETTPAA